MANFIDPEKTLFAAGLASGQSVADLGAGGGFYSFAASKIVGDQGAVLAVDILESTLDHIAAEARVRGLRNVKTLHADLEQIEGLKAVATGSIDVVILANLLHQIKDRKQLLSETYRILKTGGKVVLIEWNQLPSPFGPSADERIDTAEANKLASNANLKPAGVLATDAYHYGLMYIK